MPKQRAGLFEEGEAQELDLASFEPKTFVDAQAPRAEQVRAVAQVAKFHSREPVPHQPAVQAKRATRRYRTGRNVQLNAKVLQETLDLLYAITDANEGWVLGYTLQRAMEALQRELKNTESASPPRNQRT